MRNDLDIDLAARLGLEKLGYTQELNRNRGLFHILFMALTLLAVPYSLVAPIATSLAAGGPVVMLWGWILVALLTQMVALSVAEICSKYPTSAGAYYWCYHLSPARYKRILSWINGWICVVGMWTGTLSVTFGTAQLIIAGAGIFHPDWVATPWQTYLIFLGVTAIACGSCLFFNRYLPTIDIACACWTVLGIVAVLLSLSIKAAAGRRSVSFVLSDFEPASGWTPGWSFFIGLLPAAYSFGGICAISNMAEEVHDPSNVLPKALSLMVPLGTVCGIIFLLPILFTLPDVSTLLQVSSGQPIGLMFTLATGSTAGGFGLWFIIFGTAMFCTISCSCVASRATWAFSRDKAIPLHSIFSKINTRLSIPVNALLLSTTIQILLGLIYLGSSTAFNAFASVAVVCFSVVYAMPIMILLVGGRKDVASAPFKLGRAGMIVNAIAVLWSLFTVVLFSMPAIIPVTNETMNYSSVVLVWFLLFGVLWYLISGRFEYAGPSISSTHSGSESELATRVVSECSK